MGGIGSGRYGGRQKADASRKVDLAWMMREGLARDGCKSDGYIEWGCNGDPRGSAGYRTDLSDPDNARLVLSYALGEGEDREEVEQIIRLTYTEPHLGGRRWWMICPLKGLRVGKLYMPNGASRFASRKHWRLAYHSQGVSARHRPFEKLFRLQRRLGCEIGWGQPITRPKGMHRRTYERYLRELEAVDRRCTASTAALLSALKVKS